MPACDAAQSSVYAAARDDLLKLLANQTDLTSRDAFADAVLARIGWREETLPQLPVCADALTLPQAPECRRHRQRRPLELRLCGRAGRAESLCGAGGV